MVQLVKPSAGRGKNAGVSVASWLLYWHTLRYLRAVQLVGRLKFWLHRPGIDASPAPARRRRVGRWVEPTLGRTSLVGPARFFFLNETHDLANHGWDDPQLEKLWRYNLHYFADLTADGAHMRHAWHTALLCRWVNENPPGIGTGWEPYPTSLRIVNWIKWAMAGNELPAPCVQSLVIQLRWLARRLEYHLLGNHLFVNAKALIYGGCFYAGPEAEHWWRRGLDILAREIPEQILPDGGQYELSPMYHALALEDLLDLLNITTAFAPASPPGESSHELFWRERIGGMRDWLCTMCHPDGEIGFFNDAAIGIAPPPAALEAYAVRLGLPARSAVRGEAVTVLPASGYIRVQQGNGVALLDTARVGPDYMPGHAHADTLSFEFSLAGQRVLVNSGTSRYGLGEERLRQRGTAAHNTVVIEGQNSSEVWSGFRVARRARPVDLVIQREPIIEISCAHDGYRWLPGSPHHRRRWIFPPGELLVEDRVVAISGTAVTARFHLHPAVKVEGDNAEELNRCELRLPDGRTISVRVVGGRLRVESSTWHPGFGEIQAAHCLMVEFTGEETQVAFRWGS